jgi:hypothetical protein
MLHYVAVLLLLKQNNKETAEEILFVVEYDKYAIAAPKQVTMAEQAYLFKR